MKNLTPEQYYDKKIDKLNDPAARRHPRVKVPDKDECNFHISAICGKAMAPLAGLINERGYKVSGSDKQYLPPMSNILKEIGIEENDFDEKNVKNKDIVIIGNALGPDNIECKTCRKHNIPYISVAEALNKYILNRRKVLVVSGTHGKTTTTGLLAQILEDNAYEPGYLIGGVQQNLGKSYSYGNGDIFIIEGDEYDTAYFDKRPKFLHYNPTGLIITSLELDHTDIFRDEEDYIQAFKFLVNIVPKEGCILLCADNKASSLKKFSHCKTITYGFSKDADIRIVNHRNEKGYQNFTLLNKQEIILGEFSTTLCGKYNCSNIAASVILSNEFGIDYKNSNKSVRNFRGMKKRQEIIAINNDDITLIDDYAHHPTAVKVTIDGLRAHYASHRRLITIFEPGSNSSRRKDFESIYPESFKNSDYVILKTPKFKHNDSNDNFMDISNVANLIKSLGISVDFFDNNSDIITSLEKYVKPLDVIITMSNSDFDNIQEEIINKLNLSPIV